MAYSLSFGLLHEKAAPEAGQGCQVTLLFSLHFRFLSACRIGQHISVRCLCFVPQHVVIQRAPHRIKTLCLSMIFVDMTQLTLQC